MPFRKDFLWGSASAAFQVEGAWALDGKGPGIWDTLGREKGRIAHGETGDVACDHYHRFREDVALMKQMGLKHYRFSISWPRILPGGTGRVNEKGFAFYRALADELIGAGIVPMATLYHWNLPHALYERGGWKNPESPAWFEEYARTAARALGSRVPWWITFNEPQIFLGLGHRIGIHAPFEHSPDEDILLMTRHVLLAHGRAVRALRETLGGGIRVGFSPTGDCFLPESDAPGRVEEARRRSFLLGEHYMMSNAWWMDPVCLGRFPEEADSRFGEKMYFFSGEEWALVRQPLDFYGVNIYHGKDGGETDAKPYGEYAYTGSPRTMAGWNVTPGALYWGPRFLQERYGLPILITENGMAGMDWVSLDGRVHDPQRIDYLHRYLKELRRAADDGVEILGYTCWSLTDNLEWASGYDQRFGLVHVDFRTLERTVKDSGRWYADVIRTNGAEL